MAGNKESEELLKVLLTNNYKKPEGFVLELPKGLTHLGAWGLTSCSNITDIIWNDEITNIGDTALGFLNRIETLVFPDSITTMDGGYICHSMSALKEVSIPPKVDKINTQSFTNCKNCTLYDFSRSEQVVQLQVDASQIFTTKDIPSEAKIVVPNHLYEEWINTEKWQSVKSYIISYDEYIIIPLQEERLKTLHNKIKKNKTQEDNISLTGMAADIVALANEVKYQYQNNLVVQLLERTITRLEIPEGIKYLRAYACGQSRKLTEIIYPSSLWVIEPNACRAMDLITKIDLSKCTELSEIGAWSFAFNSSLTNFIAPPNIKKIYNNAFNGNTKCLTYDFSQCGTVPTFMPVTGSESNNTFLGIPKEAKILVSEVLYNTWIEQWGNAIVNDKGETLAKHFEIKKD